MNPYNNLEFIHELINEIYSIYKDTIEDNIKNIFEMFVKEFENIENDDNFIQMLTRLQNINYSSEQINTINVTSKYCEIITKIIFVIISQYLLFILNKKLKIKVYFYYYINFFVFY